MGKRTTGIIMAGLTLGGLLLAGSPAWAQTDYNPYIDQRQDYQEHRIQQGVDSGALTPGEARYLGREQARIQAAEERLRANGRLSPWEQHRLYQMQNQAGGDIYRLKHNNRAAPDWNGPQHPGWGRPPHPGWQGHNPGGNGHHYGWNHSNPGGNGHHYGWHNPHHRGWPGPAHHPGHGRWQGPQAHKFQGTPYGNHGGWQGQPRFQHARPPMGPAVMRPPAPVGARHPGALGSMVNRANFSPQRRK